MSYDNITKLNVLGVAEGMEALADGKPDVAFLWGLAVAGGSGKTLHHDRFGLRPGRSMRN